MANLEGSIQQIFNQNDCAAYGFADLKGILEGEFIGYTHAISFAVKLNPTIINSITTGPNQAYCDEYKNVNLELDHISSQIERVIRENGFKANKIPASKRTDFKQLRGDFPHKTAATRAGIGWIGKNSLLVTKRHGSRIRLSTILTDYPLRANQPIEKDQCGKCIQCIQNCPAGAIFGEGWTPGVEREKLINVHRCDQWKQENYSEFCSGHVCGICVAVCPFGKRGSPKD